MTRAIIGAALLAVLSIPSSAEWAKVAAEWPNLTDDQKQWFKGLHNDDGFICCDVADGHPIEQWEIRGNSYWVFFRDKWLEVPPHAVIKGPNKVGTATLWWGQFGIRCFVPGSGA